MQLIFYPDEGFFDEKINHSTVVATMNSRNQITNIVKPKCENKGA